MAHTIAVADEQYIFRSETRRKIYILLATGIVLFVLGLFMAKSDEGHSHEEHHASVASEKFTASAQQHEHEGTHADAHGAGQHEVSEHHENPVWVKRIFTTLWMNNIYFVGLGIIGLFFVAIQYAAQAGWSAGILRVPLSMGNWIPVAGVLTLVLWFIVKGDVFHWTHHTLYEDGAGFDAIISKKAPYFFWPLHAGGFPLFYILRMVIFFGLWYYFFLRIRKYMLAEDLQATTSYWYKNRVLATVFLIIFAVSSSVAAWDWVMSIDTHWFSTMFGWYMFASWWVTGLAFITLIVAYLKDAGYLKVVNSNHLHDLGKFVFAFSIFWTYVWFGQFLLIYYANIGEELIYFIERLTTGPYQWIFYLNVIVNFALPFLLLMTRDAKRQISTLKLVCPIVIVGHWFDFYNMITPGVMHQQGGLGFLEIGTFCIFLSVFLLVTLSGLSRIPLIGKNHPMLQESLHHHI